MQEGHSLYKMDKFRKIVTDPFYAGIVEIDKQVKIRNENGLHEPLITKAQHLELIRIMNDKKKCQSGPRKNGNPKYPLSNLVTCSLCIDSKIGRFVGFDHGNGKNPNLVYEKYRCRACSRYLTRQELHPKIIKQFTDRPVSDEGVKALLKAIDIVWKQNENHTEQEISRINHKIKTLNDNIAIQVEAATDPSNASIKEDVLNAITKKKVEVAELEELVLKLNGSENSNKEEFLKFAFKFIDDMGNKFLEISYENRQRCKQIVFPAGFYLDANENVYTPEISPLYRVATNKKDLPVTEKSLLVRVRGL